VAEGETQKAAKVVRPTTYSSDAGIALAVLLRHGFPLRSVGDLHLPSHLSGLHKWRERNPECDRLVRAALLCRALDGAREDMEEDPEGYALWRREVGRAAAAHAITKRQELLAADPSIDPEEVDAAAREYMHELRENVIGDFEARVELAALIDAAIFGRFPPGVFRIPEEIQELVYRQVVSGEHDEELGRTTGETLKRLDKNTKARIADSIAETLERLRKRGDSEEGEDA